MTDLFELAERWQRNPLLKGIHLVSKRVAALREKARQFFHSVALSAHACPVCSGSLTMTGPSACRCSCGRAFDPTIEFQRSSCCGAKLKRRQLHYACSTCSAVVPSRFLFDERLFDAEYFAEKMRESRHRKQVRREKLLERLAGTRSDALCLTDLPTIGSVPGLGMALNDFVGSMPAIPLTEFRGREEFSMRDYRLSLLEEVPPDCLIRFDAIPPICEDRRLDRIRKFITLIFMEQAREALLTQDGEEIMVELNETDAEGW
jgi:hypothetical protein